MKKINASVCAVSHMGIIAEHNEDNLFINGKTPSEEELNRGFIDTRDLSEPFVVAVCDGEGGSKAAEAGVNALGSHLDNILKSNSSCARIFENCIITANEAICGKTGSDEVTTLSAVYAYEDKMSVCIIGNSPVFRFSDGNLTQIDGGISGKLKRIGVQLDGDNLVPSVITVDDVKSGDYIVVCTAGLTGMVSPGQIKEILAGNDTAKKAATYLMKVALENGGKTNVSVIVLKIDIEEVSDRSESSEITSVLGAIMTDPIEEPEAEDPAQTDAGSSSEETPAEASADVAEENPNDVPVEPELPDNAEETGSDVQEYQSSDNDSYNINMDNYSQSFADSGDVYSNSNGFSQDSGENEQPFADSQAVQSPYDQDYYSVSAGNNNDNDRPSKKDWIIYVICLILLGLCIALAITLINAKKSNAELQKQIDELTDISSETDINVSNSAGNVYGEVPENLWEVKNEWSLEINSAKVVDDRNGDGEDDIAVSFSFKDLSGGSKTFDMRSHDDEGTRVDTAKIIENDYFGSSVQNVGESTFYPISSANEVIFSNTEDCTHIKISVGMKDSQGNDRFHVFIVELETK